jgi:o-succinylbenzoate synthase
MKATFKKYTLNFKLPGGTSRGVLHSKETYFLRITKDQKVGVGECALFKGLSADDRPDYEKMLQWICSNIQLDSKVLLKELIEFPSIQFGLEQAFLSLKGEDTFELFSSEFTKGKEGISINGLIWMGDRSFMQKQIAEKLKHGFKTLKLKIGAIDFITELNLLKNIRKEFSSNEIELRVDANGAFESQDALEKIKQLSDFDLHSIEQPIKAGQWQEMAGLCAMAPMPIALDEELIGIFDESEKEKMIQTIKPQYIILKPSLIGGFHLSDTWVKRAKRNNISWWITSALESNIGLNAIAQYTYTLQSEMPQGLGTGGLFTNNIESSLKVINGSLFYSPDQNWTDIDVIFCE